MGGDRVESGKLVILIMGGLLTVLLLGLVYVHGSSVEKISALQEELGKFEGVNINSDNVEVFVNKYNKNPVVLTLVLSSGKELEIEPGHIRYTCFNYVVEDTRLTIEAKKLGKTPVRFYLFDYEKYFKNEPASVIYGGDFVEENQTYYLNRFSAMQLGRTYCIGFSVPTKIYTSTGWQDVAANGKVWFKAIVKAYVDLYPEEIMKKE